MPGYTLGPNLGRSVRSISSQAGLSPARHTLSVATAVWSTAGSARPVPDTVDFPYAAQVVVVYRHTTDLAGRPMRTEVAYAITGLGSSRPAPPGWDGCFGPLGDREPAALGA